MVDAGLFLVLATLVGLELLVSTTAADAVVQYVSPVLAWVQCWMPLFYAPLLVPLPLTLRHVSGNTLSIQGPHSCSRPKQYAHVRKLSQDCSKQYYLPDTGR